MHGRTENLSKIVVCITEDWFALSHFKPLIQALTDICDDVVVVCRSSGRTGEIRDLGARVIAFDFQRGPVRPRHELLLAMRLRAILKHEAPSTVHFIAMKPIVLGSMAMAGLKRPGVVVHMTGLGFLTVATDRRSRVLRTVALRMARSLLRRPNAHLLVENPDDLESLAAGRPELHRRATILGGAGVDPEHFAACAPPSNPMTRAAYVGRMIASKGVNVLLDAMRIAKARGVPLGLDLYGPIDRDNPDALAQHELDTAESIGVRWHGPIDDVRKVWCEADIFVMATHGGEGLPRALLEAASCGRPLVVTDVPGCRQFVRDGVEGIVVPPGNASALADALARLAGDPDLRRRMGEAARERVLAGFTEAHVKAATQNAYRKLTGISAGPDAARARGGA